MRTTVSWWSAAIAMVALALGIWIGAPTVTCADPNGEEHDDDKGGHVHVPAPLEYADSHAPLRIWTDPKMIARGKEIYTTTCAVCHGDAGDGKGPAGLALPLKPSSFRDRAGVAEMRDNYWFWRISEGGQVEPFKSKGSAMPPWKGTLSVDDRWAVMAYQHTFTSHNKAFWERAEIGTVEIPPRPRVTPERVARGKQLYADAECLACHGDRGRGDGKSAPALKDDLQLPIQPTDLTRPQRFKNGRRPEDVYRTLMTGFAGTPMPSYADALEPEQA